MSELSFAPIRQTKVFPLRIFKLHHYRVAEPYFQSASTSNNPTDGASCIASIGAAQAQKLADRCTRVSPAAHPPCNVQNSCALITDEIRRGCAMLSASDAPGFCSEYR